MLIAMLASCTTPPTPRPEDERRVVSWRLVERAYESIEESWASAGDGEIAAGANALFFEPVYPEERKSVELLYREEQKILGDLVTARTACSHRPRVRYDGPSSVNVGDPVRIVVWVDGPTPRRSGFGRAGGSDGVAHEVNFTGSHAAVVILKVSGAPPLSGEPGRYLLASGARAEVLFTSRREGRGGLVISVEEEHRIGGGPGGPARAEDE